MENESNKSIRSTGIQANRETIEPSPFEWSCIHLSVGLHEKDMEQLKQKNAHETWAKVNSSDQAL